MADDITLNLGSGGSVVATDDVGGIHYQIVKMTYGALDAATIAASGAGAVSAGVPRFTLASDDPGVALLGTIDTDTGVIAGDTTSLDGKIVVGAGTEAGAVRVTLATDSTGVLSIDDNGGTLTVDSGAAFTVQEDGAALTALQLIDNAVYVENAALGATPSGNLAMARQDAALTATGSVDDDATPLTVDANGALWVTPSGTVTVDGSGVTQPVSGTVTANPASGTIDTVTNLAQMGAAAISMNTGVRDTGTQRVTIATNDSVPVTGTITANLSTTDNTVLDNIQTSVDTVAAAVSTQMQVDVVAALPAGAAAIGDVGISGARTSGGTTLYKNIDVDESEDQVKGSAGQVYWIHCINLSASVLFLKVYDEVGASVTVGTTVPDLTFPIPTQGDTNGAGFTISIPNGIAMGTGITVAATTGIADNDSGAPGANTVVVNLGYA